MRPIISIPMITYAELYKLLFEKFHATHDEIRYWIKLSFNFSSKQLLFPYLSDISCHDYPLGSAAQEDFLNPEYHFYDKEKAQEFKPDPFHRLVYRKDFSGKRNWQEKDDSIFTLLKSANELGILRCYDKNSDTFTLHAPKHKMSYNSIDRTPYKGFLWCNTFEGENYFNNPDSFFLLYDILTFERVFLGKSLETCYKEIGLEYQ